MFSERVVQRLDDIVVNADRVADYIHGLSLAAFTRDQKTVDATERCIERVIEASIQIGPETMAQILESFPAAQIRGMGNRLRHEYGSVNASVVWNTATGDLPPLRDACMQALERARDAR